MTDQQSGGEGNTQQNIDEVSQEPSAPNPEKKSILHRLNEPWAIIIAALVTGLFVIIAALIQRGDGAILTSTPDLTATHAITQTAQVVALAPTDTPGVPMATFSTGVNVRSGPDTVFASLGALGVNDSVEVLAVNADGTWYKVEYAGGDGWVFGDLTVILGDASRLPVDSGPPAPTIRPTNTVAPTATATPSQTPVPPTPTVTDTPAPPTLTRTPPPAITPSQSSADTITLTIFRDDQSFTLYVPQSVVPVSLVGLEFRVNVTGDEQISLRLDQDYAAFLGLPFGNISSLGAVCF